MSQVLQLQQLLLLEFTVALLSLYVASCLCFEIKDAYVKKSQKTQKKTLWLFFCAKYLASTIPSPLLSAITSVRYFQISNKLLSVHPCSELHLLWLPLTCCLHVPFLPLVTALQRSASSGPFCCFVNKKKITQTMAEVVLKTKMKKHLIAGSKVSRNCFSNIPTGSSLRR